MHIKAGTQWRDASSIALWREHKRDYVDALAPKAEAIVLDIDATDNETHRDQQLSFFHGFHDATCSIRCLPSLASSVRRGPPPALTTRGFASRIAGGRGMAASHPTRTVGWWVATCVILNRANNRPLQTM